jgi:hypothetical protein
MLEAGVDERWAPADYFVNGSVLRKARRLWVDRWAQGLETVCCLHWLPTYLYCLFTCTAFSQCLRRLPSHLNSALFTAYRVHR